MVKSPRNSVHSDPALDKKPSFLTPGHTMTITGKSFIAGTWQMGAGTPFEGVNPVNNQPLAPGFASVDTHQLDQALHSAAQAESELRASTLHQKAHFLQTCADEIMALGDALTQRFCLETGYPIARAASERARTCGQLRMFADYVLSGRYLDARIDTALPHRTPLPRPDLRYINQSLGPVVVFGASNFPLAYSVAGGDTASAFAAGCPVIVKSHPSHPGTAELVAQAIVSAVEKCGLPTGTFNFVNGKEHEIGAYLVQSPVIKAVGFTGSQKGGVALFKLANSRPEPIPVFAEMGSINPVFLLPRILSAEAEQLAKKFVGSLTLGTGQFCVNPGLLVAQKSPELDTFLEYTSNELTQIDPGVMLNKGIQQAYYAGSELLQDAADVVLVQEGVKPHQCAGLFVHSQLFKTSAKTFINNKTLQEELFGPSSLVVECDTREELLNIAKDLQGQLTGSVHGTATELIEYKALITTLTTRVGRVVINGFPTGVEVAPSMVHGGPFPASTDSRFTAVGTAAIKRFIRPVCYQNCPEPLLPKALHDSNPMNIPRQINGVETTSSVK